MGLGVMQGLDVIMAFFDGGLAGTAQCSGILGVSEGGLECR